MNPKSSHNFIFCAVDDRYTPSSFNFLWAMKRSHMKTVSKLKENFSDGTQNPTRKFFSKNGPDTKKATGLSAASFSIPIFYDTSIIENTITNRATVSPTPRTIK